MPIVFDFNTSLVGVSNHRKSAAGHIGLDGLYRWDTTHDTLRLDHDLGGGFGGLLVEPKRTNVYPLNHTMNFSGTEVNTSGASNGVTTVNPNSQVGIDGQLSAHLFTMAQTQSRWWYDGTPWAAEYAIASQYVKRHNGDARDLAFGYLVNSVHYPKAFSTPASGFERLIYRSPVPMGTNNNGPTVYFGNRRNHPLGENNGPTSHIACGFQVELVDGASLGASSLIWTAGAPVTREADIVTLSPIPNGRYHIRVVGDQGPYIWPDVEIRNNQWIIDTVPHDFHVRRVEFYETETTTHIDGVPIVVNTVGGGGADYPDLAAARAAMPSSLVLANQIRWLKMLPGTHLEGAAVSITAATDARHPVWISSTDYGHAAKNNRQHWWNTRNRTRVHRNTSSAINVGTDYLSIWGLAVDGLTMNASTSQGDPSEGFVLVRDCMVSEAIDQGSNGGPYTRAVNCHLQGHGFPNLLNATTSLTLAAFHCTAIAGAAKSSTDTHRGLTGTLWNSIAVNYPGTRGLAGKIHFCATDASDGSAGLANLTYAQIFKEAFANPQLADASPLLAAGEFRAEAQYDIRGDARPTTGGVDVGMVNKAAVTDLTYAELVALAKEGKPQPINRNYASQTFVANPHWDGSGGLANEAFFRGWSSYAVVPIANRPKIAGHGGGHGAGAMDAGRTMFNRNGDFLWERIVPDPEVQVIAKDHALGPVYKNPASPRFPNNDPTIPGDWLDGSYVPLDAHYYGGGGGNGAVSADNSYMVMLGSSFFSTSGGSPHGNRLSILDLLTGYWDPNHSGSQGEFHGGVGNGGKAFIEVEPGKRILWMVTSSQKAIKFDLMAARGSGLQTGVGQEPGVWGTYGAAPTGSDGGAAYVPGLRKALAWQRDTEDSGTPFHWIDVSTDFPVVTPATPTGDVPPSDERNGAAGHYVPEDGHIHLYTGQFRYRVNPNTLVFEKISRSQKGADLKSDANLSAASASAKAVFGLTDEGVQMLAAGPDDDVYLIAPVVNASVATPLAMLLGL